MGLMPLYFSHCLFMYLSISVYNQRKHIVAAQANLLETLNYPADILLSNCSYHSNFTSLVITKGTFKNYNELWNDQWSSGGDMNTNGNEKDGDESKEDNGVDQYGDPASPHVAEVHHSAVARQLEQQPALLSTPQIAPLLSIPVPNLPSLFHLFLFSKVCACLRYSNRLVYKVGDRGPGMCVLLWGLVVGYRI